MTLALLHPPSREYIDPWTGELFHGSSSEPNAFHIAPVGSESAGKVPGVEGGVIMSKLGNETAKYVIP
jgi:hypothetical protein